MDTAYFGWMTAIVVFGVIMFLFVVGSEEYSEMQSFWCAAFALSVLSVVIMFCASFATWRLVAQEQRPCTIYRTADIAAFKAVDWPEQYSTDINRFEKPCVITQHTFVNAWGCNKKFTYTIDLVPDPTIPQKQGERTN